MPLSGPVLPEMPPARGAAIGAAVGAEGPLRPLTQSVNPYYRNVRAFWGEVNPFYRNVRAFWGDVDPFYRNVRAFWGDMDPAEMASQAGGPDYAGVGPFWEDQGTRWEEIATLWQNAGEYTPETERRYAGILRRLRKMVGAADQFWGDAVSEDTGSAFRRSFVSPLLKRYGIRFDDPSTLARLDAATQSQFFMEWYDGLMAHAGTDHADWWMRAINWSPDLTQKMGSGAGSTLGLVDDYSATSADILARVRDLTHRNASAGGHGEGVLSLVVSPHDGRGVMGIAPGASVIAYNPFDNGSADWQDVSDGIQAVAAEGATVINLSLGAPGVTLSPEWQRIFTKSEINTHKDKTLYIIAAGNDGISQTGIVDMKGALDTTFIVVGSVGPSGISDFSNRPGTACLTDGGTECKASSSLKESGYLMNRFIVAPGELILVSDGKGGVIRQSGTSLAAPLVAGAVALVQDRWPWMREKPRDIAMVILGSATDLGAPGIDPVYGVGMLNVEAAMSPLDFSKLKYYLTSNDGESQNEVSVSTLRSGGIQAGWVTNDMYFTAFEKLDQVERDFLIPLSSRLYGTTRGGEYFMDFVYNRMVQWIDGASFAGRRAVGFSDTTTTPAVDLGGWTVQMRGRTVLGFGAAGRIYRPALHSTASVSAPSGRFGFSFGSGDGAMALGGGGALSMVADFDPYAGGANPLLGFASGGAHAAAQVSLAPGLEVRAGFTERRRIPGEEDGVGFDTIGRAIQLNPASYRADATTMDVRYRAAPWLTVSGSATTLHEPRAFLGVRPLMDGDLSGGTRTDGFTAGIEANLGAGTTLFGTATRAYARSPQRDGSLRLADDGASGTSFQAGIARVGLLGRQDALRLTVAQPLRVDGGAIELTEVQVVNRETGETGVVTQRFDLGKAQPRRLVLEGNYAAPLLDGRAQLSLFGRGELRDLDQGTPRLMAGGRIQIAF